MSEPRSRETLRTEQLKIKDDKRSKQRTVDRGACLQVRIQIA